MCRTVIAVFARQRIVNGETKMPPAIAKAWLKLRSKQWGTFAAGAALMLGAWHLYVGQPEKVAVDVIVMLFFLLK
jgi:hypothetical protein